MITLLTFKKFEYSPYLKIKKKRREIKDMRKDTHDHKLIAAARDVNKFQLKSALVLGTTRELHEMWSEHFNIVYVIERIFVLFTSLFMTLNSSDRSWDSWLVRRNCWKRRLSECETSSWRIPHSSGKIGCKPTWLLGVWRLVSISSFFDWMYRSTEFIWLCKVAHLPIVPFLTTDCLVIDRRWRLRVVRTNKRYAKCS